MATSVPYKIYKAKGNPNNRPDLLPDLSMTDSAYARSQNEEITPQDFIQNYYNKDKAYYDSYFNRSTTPGVKEAFQQIISGSTAPIESGYRMENGVLTTQAAIDSQAQQAKGIASGALRQIAPGLTVPTGSPADLQQRGVTPTPENVAPEFKALAAANQFTSGTNAQSVVDFLTNRGFKQSGADRLPLYSKRGEIYSALGFNLGEYRGSAEQNMAITNALSQAEKQAGVSITPDNLMSVINVAKGSTGLAASAALPFPDVGGLQDKIGTRPSPSNPAITEYYDKATGKGFANPEELRQFVNQQRSAALPFPDVGGLQDKIGTRPSPSNPAITEYYDKATGKGFANPQELREFVEQQKGIQTGNGAAPVGQTAPGTAVGMPANLQAAIDNIFNPLAGRDLAQEAIDKFTGRATFPLEQESVAAEKEALQLKSQRDTEEFIKNIASRGLIFSGAKTKGINTIEADKLSKMLGVDRSFAMLIAKGLETSAQDIAKEAQKGSQDALGALEKLGFTINPLTGAIEPTLAARNAAATEARSQETQERLERSAQATEARFEQSQAATQARFEANYELSLAKFNKTLENANDFTRSDKNALVFDDIKTRTTQKLMPVATRREGDGFTDPREFIKFREEVASKTPAFIDDFDKAFATLLNPRDAAFFGINQADFDPFEAAKRRIGI